MRATFLSKIQNICLLCLCIAYSFVRGKANKKILNPRAVLVVQMAKLGDMICTTPVFRAVKEKYPGCRVIVLGSKHNRGLLDGNPDVDRYVSWNGGIRELYDLLRGEKIEYACLITPHFPSLAGLFLLGIPSIAVPVIKNGWSPYENLSFRWLRRLVIAVPYRMGEYAYREYLRMVEPIGVYSENTAKHLAYSKEALAYAESFIVEKAPGSLHIAISPSTGNKIKNWQPEKFAQIADWLIEKYGAKIFIIGTERDRNEIEEMIAASRHKGELINTMNILSIDQLKAFMSKMHLFIAVDTGPIYIADAFNVPTVDILGAVSEKEHGPRGALHRMVYDKDRKSNVLFAMNTRVYDTTEARRQIDSISAETVQEAAEELLGHVKSKISEI